VSQQKPDIAAAYDRHADMLYRLALSHLQNTDDAQDAVHDVFAKYMDTAPTFRDPEHERAWFIRATINRCHDLFRRKKIRTHLPLEDIAELVADSTEQADRDTVNDIMQTIAAIPEKNRAAVVLHCLEGYPVETVAVMLDISVSAVKMRLSRGREALKHLMTQKGYEI